MTDDSRWAACGKRAWRPFQAGRDLRGELALTAEEEIEDTLLEKAEKKAKPARDAHS